MFARKGTDMNAFEELGVCKALADALRKEHIEEPMAIQREAIPRILKGQGLIGQSPTGTGKTLAYLLPLLQRIKEEVPQVQVLVLAPTYELSMQIARTAQQLAERADMGLRVLGLIGGANIARQMEKLKKKPQCIVGSPGRILELSRKGKLKLDKVNCLVLDEFDRLLDDQNAGTVTELARTLPKDVQYLMFSATAPKKARERADFLNHPEFLRAEGEPARKADREDLCVMVSFRDKIERMRKLAQALGVKRGLVFVNRSFDAQRTLEKLRYEGIRAESLLGSENKVARKKALEDFQRGKIQLLLATDLAARGLDIPEVDYVFNLDLPESANVYLHRAGRTARAGAKGTVITLADEREIGKLGILEKKLGIPLKPLKKIKDNHKQRRDRKIKNAL